MAHCQQRVVRSDRRVSHPYGCKIAADWSHSATVWLSNYLARTDVIQRLSDANWWTQSSWLAPTERVFSSLFLFFLVTSTGLAFLGLSGGRKGQLTHNPFFFFLINLIWFCFSFRVWKQVKGMLFILGPATLCHAHHLLLSYGHFLFANILPNIKVDFFL